MPVTAGSGIDIATIIDGKEVQRIYQKLQQYPKKIGNKLASKAGRSAAKVLAKKVKELVPVDSGDLEDSIKVRAAKGRRDGAKGAMVITGKGFFKGDTYYGGMIEYGTKRMPNQSFLRHAAILARDQVVSEWARVMKSLMNSAAKEVSR